MVPRKLKEPKLNSKRSFIMIHLFSRYVLLGFIFVTFLQFLVSCLPEDNDRAQFTDPGFAVAQYEEIPLKQVIVECVVINTPQGFDTIEATILSGGGVLDTVFTLMPEQGNKKQGYASILFTTPEEEDTTRIELKVIQQNNGEVYTKIVEIITKIPDTFYSLAHFLEANPKYSEVLKIAQKSSYWQPGEVLDVNGNIDMLKSYGFTNGSWAITFFPVPNGTFDPLIQQNPHFRSLDDIDQFMADQLITTMILAAKDPNGSYVYTYDEFSQINCADIFVNSNNARMVANIGGIAFDFDKENPFNTKVGRADKSGSNKFVPGVCTADTLKATTLADTNRIAGMARVHPLTGHFLDLSYLDGNVVPHKSLRSDAVLALLGWSAEARGAMNALNGEGLFSGSGHFMGTLFIPLNQAILSTYDIIPHESPIPVKEWNWTTFKVEGKVTSADVKKLEGIWGDHNVESIDKIQDWKDGDYLTKSGKTITVSGNVSSVSMNGVTANIVKKIRYYDGGDMSGPKVLFVIDKMLYK